MTVTAVDPKSGEPPKVQRFTTLPNGLEIACQSAKETEHIYDDIFAHRVYLSGGITLWDGATVFDVGGNIGLFTVFLHQTWRDLKTYTFEPAPPLFEIMRYNTRLHATGHCNLFNCGLSDAHKSAEFTFYPYSSGMSSFYGDEKEEKEVLLTVLENQKKGGDSEAETVLEDPEAFLDARFTQENFTCELLPLSALVDQEGVETIDLLKIDVQKSELDVLRGIEDEHWPKIRQIAMEVHDLDGELAVVRSLLEEHGFSVVVEQDPLYVNSVMYNLFAIQKNLYQSLAGSTGEEISAAAVAGNSGRGQRRKQGFARFRRQKKGG